METKFGNLSTGRQHLLRKIIFDLAHYERKIEKEDG